jgi:hypothetical protein
MILVHVVVILHQRKRINMSNNNEICCFGPIAERMGRNQLNIRTQSYSSLNGKRVDITGVVLCGLRADFYVLGIDLVQTGKLKSIFFSESLHNSQI